MFPISLSATHATPLQNWRAIRAIIRKDLRVALQSKAVLLPMIIVPVVLVVLLPALVALVPLGLQTIDPAVSQRESADLAELWAIAPVALKEELAGYALEQAVIVFMLLVTIQAASNLTGTCCTEMVRLWSGDALLLEKCRSNGQEAE
jgi:ABC-type transport system involved in cytochrome c biogenesis permease component